MKLTSILRTLGLAALSSGVLVAGSFSASAACKPHKHTAQGSSSGVQYLASVSAKQAWKSKVSAHDGAAWDTWWKATDKRVACAKSGPGATWVCTARARPCN